jgi:hypothetical protein
MISTSTAMNEPMAFWRIINFQAYCGVKFNSPMLAANKVAVTLSLSGAPQFH